jgi:hypothetical protein
MGIKLGASELARIYGNVYETTTEVCGMIWDIKVRWT